MTKNLIETVFSPVKMFSHKRVHRYIHYGENIYPITKELGPSGPQNCNNKCNFCMHAKYYNKNAIMDFSFYKDILSQLKETGTKGMIFSASGEPTTNPKIVDFIKYTKESEIDVALITNGTGWKKSGLMEATVDYVTWARTSLDAGTPETRAKIHGVRYEDFENVLGYLTELALLKKERKSKVHLGAQIVVTEENFEEIIEATRKVAKTGIDYMQIKPVVYHPADKKQQLSKEFWQEVLKLAIIARDLYEEQGEFDVFIKSDQFSAIMKPDYDKSAYNICRAIFFPIIEADGKVYHCSQTRGMPEFELGDLKENSFKEIWNSEQRKQIIKNIDVSKCQPVCRCHWLNKVFKTVMKGEHAPNFI